VTQNEIAAFLEAFLIPCSQQGVQQDVVGFQCGIGFQLATPVAVIELPGEEVFSGSIDRDGYAAGKIVYLAKS
jgi:hypothetical protein